MKTLFEILFLHLHKEVGKAEYSALSIVLFSFEKEWTEILYFISVYKTQIIFALLI